MKVVIAGSGKIGSNIMESLINEGHDVTVIDKNKDVVSDVVNCFDVMSVNGSINDYDTLVESGVKDAGVFIATTDSDELNMISCRLAKSLGAERTIARVRNPEYGLKSIEYLKQNLDIDLVINPEKMTAKEISNILQFPSAASVEKFSGRKFEMVQTIVRENSPLVGLSMIQIRKKFKSRILFCVVGRGSNVYIPSGDFVIEAGDRIGVTADVAALTDFFRETGMLKKKAKTIFIFGASATTYYLATMLVQNGNNVKIIDADETRCKKFSSLIPGATIICGEAVKSDLLLEEGIKSADAFVALTGIDEDNILVTYMVSSYNVPTVISKVNSPELTEVAAKMGLEIRVSPENIVSDIIVAYTRALENSKGGSVETVYRIMDGKAEALKFKVDENFAMLNVPLKDMKLKKNILIAGIIRDRRNYVPSGDDYFVPGDRIVVIAEGNKIKNLSDILA